mgnify:CR=1 FL=1
MAHQARVLAILMLALAGCVSGSGVTVPPTHTLVASTETPTPAPPTATATQEPLPAPADVAATSATGVVVPAQAQVLVGMVIEDLARSLDASSEEIGVISVERVSWSDARLGCEEAGGDSVPDEAARVEGFRIALSYRDQTYEYHTDDQDRFLACEAGDEAIAGELVILDPIANALVDLARRDLAARLDLPQRRVFAVEVASIVWPDTSMGCPSGEQEYLPTAVPGYRIVLRVGRQHYIYHSNYLQVIPCAEDAERLPVSEVIPEATGTVTTPE